MSGGPAAWNGWLAVCGLKREAHIWTGRAVVGGGRSDLLAQRLEAAIATERPAGLISFGVCGALDPALAVGEVLVGRSVAIPGGVTWLCNPAAAERLAALTGGRPSEIAAIDHVVADPDEKRTLSLGFCAVDMESHVAARAAAAHGLPLAVLRVVSDEAGHSLPPAAVAGMTPDGGVALGPILASLARDPSQLPALIRMGRTSGVAFHALAAARLRL